MFDWIFEVEEDATGQDPGKLVFVLEYEMTLMNQEKYGSVANKVGARVQIQHDNTYAIVPVIKVRGRERKGGGRGRGMEGRRERECGKGGR